MATLNGTETAKHARVNPKPSTVCFMDNSEGEPSLSKTPGTDVTPNPSSP